MVQFSKARSPVSEGLPLCLCVCVCKLGKTKLVKTEDNDNKGETASTSWCVCLFCLSGRKQSSICCHCFLKVFIWSPGHIIYIYRKVYIIIYTLIPDLEGFCQLLEGGCSIAHFSFFLYLTLLSKSTSAPFLCTCLGTPGDIQSPNTNGGPLPGLRRTSIIWQTLASIVMVAFWPTFLPI